MASFKVGKAYAADGKPAEVAINVGTTEADTVELLDPIPVVSTHPSCLELRENASASTSELASLGVQVCYVGPEACSCVWLH